MDVTTTVILAAFIVAVAYVVTAVVLSVLSTRQRRAERQDERAYQSERDQRAAQMTAILIETNERIASRTDLSSATLENKIDVIHGLVNSGLTAAKQSELDAIERDLVSLTALAALQVELGRPVDPGAATAIEQAQANAETLRRELAERRAADAVAQEQTERNTEREQKQRRGG